MIAENAPYPATEAAAYVTHMADDDANFRII